MGTTSNTGNIKIIESARKIDEYMSVNEFYYSDTESSYNEKYDMDSSKATNGLIYVCWCLKDAGFDYGLEQAELILNFSMNFINWKVVNDIADVSDLHPGDICYYNDNTYTVYAGNSKYWDATNEQNVKGKGAVTRNDLPIHVYRYEESEK